MEPYWINALDGCASAGILNYDASADLLDQTPRYFGNPELESLPISERPLLFPDKPKIKGYLKEDSFNSETTLVDNPDWKKWLFGGLILGTTALLLFKKSKLPNLTNLGSKINLPKFSSIKDFFTNSFKTIWKGIKAPFKYIKNIFNKKP